MNRDYIENNNVIERYHLGKLTEEEAVAFEDLFVFDKELRDEVELAEKFIYGLDRQFRSSAQTEADSTPAPVTLAQNHVHWAIAAAFVCVAALIPFLYYASQLSQSELQQRELLSMLAAERAPSISGPVIRLTQTRNGENSLPAISISIPESSKENVVLAVPILDTSFSQLKLSLSTNGNVIWSGNWPRTIPLPSNLHVTIPSPILHPGIYELTVESDNNIQGSINGFFRFRAYSTSLGISEGN